MSMSGTNAGSTAKPSMFSAWTDLPRQVIVMDLVERVCVSLMYLYFLNSMLLKSAVPVSPVTLLLIVAESLPIILIFSRGPSLSMSLKPVDWLLGIVGACTVYFAIAPEVTPLVPVSICVSLMTVGMCIQLLAKLYLGRSFGMVAANRGVKIGGPYGIVRHPMYAGYTLTHIGFLLAFPCWQNLIVYSAGLGFQILRLLREERVLFQDPSYREFAKMVPYRLLPGVF